jgi:Holliday junction resolvase-like predicted endonuclease
MRRTALCRQTHQAARTIRRYLAALPRVPVCRSNTVLISGNGTIEWIKNAFEE